MRAVHGLWQEPRPLSGRATNRSAHPDQEWLGATLARHRKLVLERYLEPGRPLRYFRESVNSGVDRDYDKAVGYASGEYCWLMTDDDLLQIPDFSAK